MINLIGFTKEDMMNLMVKIGQPRYRGNQIYRWIYREGINRLNEMTNIPKVLKEELLRDYEIKHIQIYKVFKDAKDDTYKFLLLLHDQHLIECVLMKYNFGYTLCISTQVGCRMGCKFCASTIGGVERNLTSGEIIDQIMVVNNYLGMQCSNVVLMGSGEPLDNYDEVLKFIYNVNNPDGINMGQRHITLSTCGIVPKIIDLAKKKMQINLSCSLHAPNNMIRDTLMPMNKKYPIEELLKACQFYFDETGRRVTFEYAMIHGMNDTQECAVQLVKLLKGRNCLINLIPINEIEESSFIKSEKNNIIKFSHHLQEMGLNTTIRREMGSSINAACGQLRKNFKK
ncbi:MAG: 23S rRNA (adenine(2503)-C(2))-methyltransferase RlmN [Eubacteriales bacterium]